MYVRSISGRYALASILALSLADAVRDAVNPAPSAAAQQTDARPDNAHPGEQQPTVASTPTTAVTLPPALDAAAIKAEARAAERERIKAIMGHAEAEGRSALAQHLAFNTDLAPDAAGSILATSPKAEAARTLTGATVPQPNVKPQAGETDKGDAKARLAAAVKAVTGQKA